MENTLLKVENLNIEFHDHDVPERVVNCLKRQGQQRISFYQPKEDDTKELNPILYCRLKSI